MERLAPVAAQVTVANGADICCVPGCVEKVERCETFVIKVDVSAVGSGGGCVAFEDGNLPFAVIGRIPIEEDNLVGNIHYSKSGGNSARVVVWRGARRCGVENGEHTSETAPLSTKMIERIPLRRVKLSVVVWPHKRIFVCVSKCRRPPARAI